MLLITLLFIPQNIRIMAKYYTRITMKRMAGLLDLSVDVRKHFSNLFQLKLIKKKQLYRLMFRIWAFSNSTNNALLETLFQESEEFLSSLVVNKTIYAKVDRLAGIINFQRPKDPNDLLNDWSQKLNSLMSLVNKTTHLIAKEEMIHNLQ